VLLPSGGFFSVCAVSLRRAPALRRRGSAARDQRSRPDPNTLHSNHPSIRRLFLSLHFCYHPSVHPPEMSQSSELRLSVVLDGGERVLALPPMAPQVDVATIKMMIAAETNHPPGSLVLLHKQRVLTDSQTLASLGIGNDDMLEARSGNAARAALQQQQPRPAGAPLAAAAGGNAPSSALGRSTNQLGIPDAIMADPARVRDFIRQTPALLFQIESQNPPLYRALMAAELEPFAQAWRQITERMAADRQAELERVRLATADPMDPAVQARIEEEIRLKNVQENYEMAMEYNPEAFGTVVMLYVPMKVNGHALTAFVDSGAQSTIMSVQCAERCGIMRLLDRRYAGIAKGVGQAKIHGRVHQVPCVVGTKHISMSFTILENQGMDFLLGLDQLKNHRAIIDLARGVLQFAGEELPFLAEKDIPKRGRIDGDDSEMGQSTSSSSSSSSAAAAGAAAASSSAAAKPAAASSTPSTSTSAAAGQAPLSTSGHNLAQPTQGVPSSQGAVATAAHRPAGALSASVPPPGHSPSPLPPASSANAAAVAAAQQRAQGQATPVSAVQPQQPARAPPAGGAAFSESSIEQLTQLGFTRAESIQALTVCNGNVDLAAGYLFSQ